MHALLLAELRAAGELEWSRTVADASHVRAKEGAPPSASYVQNHTATFYLDSLISFPRITDVRVSEPTFDYTRESLDERPDVRVFVLRPDNAPRVRDGYITSGTRGHLRILTDQSELSISRETCPRMTGRARSYRP